MTLHADVSLKRGNFSLNLQHAFPKGTVTTIVGPNGAGKSTLLEAIAGIVPSQATLNFDGRNLGDLPVAKRGIALLKQQALLFPHLSVKDNIEFGVLAQKRDLSVARDWIDRLDLTPLLKKLPNQLSGGQAARVGLARALATTPRLLLLDEPAAAMDVAVAQKFRRLLSTELKEHPVTTILVSHTVEDVIALADEVIVLQDGKKTAATPMPQALVEPPCAFLADLAGINRLRGHSKDGYAIVEDIPVAPTTLFGPVWVAIPLDAITLSSGGYRTTVLRKDADPSGYRLTMSRPAGLMVHAPLNDPRTANLHPGDEICIRIDENKVRTYQ